VTASLRLGGCILTNVLAPIQDAMKGNLDTWSGMIRVDWGSLRNLAKWGWSTCNEGGTVPKSGDLALGTDCDTIVYLMYQSLVTLILNSDL